MDTVTIRWPTGAATIRLSNLADWTITSWTKIMRCMRDNPDSNQTAAAELGDYFPKALRAVESDIIAAEAIYRRLYVDPHSVKWGRRSQCNRENNNRRKIVNNLVQQHRRLVTLYYIYKGVVKKWQSQSKMSV